ncbi:MAG TPA: DNA mismatch repair protein MutS [Gammaproteobacteria bacterium]|jgi:DNA-nicking Smr family endonuclease|nr:DNA mismatch repair protein MutS [Gammaproteobacteria bacterium]
MSEDKPTDEHDSALFREAIGDVKRLHDPHVPPPKKTVRPIARQAASDDQDVMDSLLADPTEQDLLDCGEHLAWARPGVQRTVLRKLRAGRFSSQGELDLHGLTQPQAREALVHFLAESQTRRHTCVRVIHGKGRKVDLRSPVLKPSVNVWLQHHKAVLAFSSARPNDGGTGAVYVLLRK